MHAWPLEVLIDPLTPASNLPMGKEPCYQVFFLYLSTGPPQWPTYRTGGYSPGLQSTDIIRVDEKKS